MTTSYAQLRPAGHAIRRPTPAPLTQHTDPGDDAPFFPDVDDDTDAPRRVDGVFPDPPHSTTDGTITFLADPETDVEGAR